MGVIFTTYGPIRPYLVYVGSSPVGYDDVIATEDGLIFAKDATGWRCQQLPELWLLPGGLYARRDGAGEFYIQGATGLTVPQSTMSERGADLRTPTAPASRALRE